MQFNKVHAVSKIALVALAAHRFVAYDGGYATAAGGVHDAQGVSETEAAAGEAVSCVTGYSYPVLTEAVIAAGDYIKPGVDGKAAVGTLADHCGRALVAAGAGELVEVQIVKHIHA